MLGAINHYVEHRGLRVVLIAHDEKLAKDAFEGLEKVIGQTTRVEPATDAAFSAFMQDLEFQQQRDFVDQHRQTIIAAFRASDVGSLRVLRHAMLDLGRLHGALTQEHLADTDSTEAHYKRIRDRLIASREKALRDRFPEIGNCLLAILADDPQEFRKQVSPTNENENPYALVPVLSGIDPDTFVAAWLAAPRANWIQIGRALENRYDAGRLNADLRSERAWLREVLDVLSERAARENGLARLRIERLVSSRLRTFGSPDDDQGVVA